MRSGGEYACVVVRRRVRLISCRAVKRGGGGTGCGGWLAGCLDSPTTSQPLSFRKNADTQSKDKYVVEAVDRRLTQWDEGSSK
ncbi:hypothetical protein RB195_000268 [Necator americanus]|uniref:Uncharacterized protein n=1 Tax=Necator americanus TaxID=51031 RepID=A0ABR1D9M8_NECAM